MIVTLEILKQQLHVDHGDDDQLLTRKAEGAQNHIERLLGFKIEETYGGNDQDPIPPALVEAVCQLVGHWYEHREAAIGGDSVRVIPHGVSDIVREYREYSFDG